MRSFDSARKALARPGGLVLGLDVGSTTVKAVVMASGTREVLWRDYVRHETRQPETCLALFDRIEANFSGVPADKFRVFATGTGGASIARHIGAAFVQEVNAVSLAVERLYPEAGAAIELGGQDAKIIVFERDPRTERLRKMPSMNDKCAGGTGAVIDKIRAKLNLPADAVREVPYAGVKLHPVAGKCGVFAETDITGLLKQGVPAGELMASLYEALVQQDLTVLARGRTLRPVVLLLGGPNYFLRGLQECWRHNLALLWEERQVALPAGKSAHDLVVVPDDAHYFPALGAALSGMEGAVEDRDAGRYTGRAALIEYVARGRAQEKRATACGGLAGSIREVEEFRKRYTRPPWRAPVFRPGTLVEGYIGLDGGSTSTKAVLVDAHKRILAKAYRLSNGNPIHDAQAIFADLRKQVERQGARLGVLGMATTGYAKDILQDVFGADAALVETVAHARGGLHHVPGADVICDVGGQDIKVIVLKNGAIKDFRLNTQCSAGNGYYLQSAAAEFGYRVEDYADVAFTAESMPKFGYGCAVFMQADIVDFQRQGWRPNEILAGLAAVLPKNIWMYVCQMPNLVRLGRTFVLQGGTQRNLAAVKAQVDFIHRRFEGTGVRPEVVVHPHCGESGAVGCALEALRLHREGRRRTTFIGFDAAAAVTFSTQRGEQTRCDFCKNRCIRTFIDVSSGNGAEPRRVIVASCEKGSVEAYADMRSIRRGLDAVKRVNPDLSRIAARDAFEPVVVDDVVAVPAVSRWWHGAGRRRRARGRHAAVTRRGEIRIGMPRALGAYGLAPFFMGLFQSLGVKPEHLVWSDETTVALYREGAKRGSIDPCYPSKLGIPHVHNLLKHHEREALDCIFFPMVDSVPGFLEGVRARRMCPAAVATPEAVHAAFVKERDLFAERGIVFKKTFLNLDWPALCARQFSEDWAGILGVDEREACRAVQQGLRALDAFHAGLRMTARHVIETLERERRLGLVLLARPYHNASGINHGVCEAFQKLGYPIIPQDALPVDREFWARALGSAEGVFAVDDVWPHAYVENSSRKLWAAKMAARHPNLVPLELSSFKCGHDAPLYAVLESIVESARKPLFYFRDIDENRPAGSQRIRIETMDYFLRQYREQILLRDGQSSIFGGAVASVELGDPSESSAAVV